MKKIALAVLLVFLVMMMPAAAAQSQNSGGNGGLVKPDSALYGLETAWDKAAVDIGLKKASSVARERVAEAEAMAEKNNTRGMEKAARQFSSMAQRSMDKNETGLNRSIDRMNSLIENAPNSQARDGMENALENMREARRNRREAGENRSENPAQENRDEGLPDRPENDQDQVPETPDSPDQDDEGADEAQDGGEQTDTTRTSATGEFDLLVSDRPADISSFDYLDVTFDRARVFSGEADSSNETSETENQTEEMNETEDDTEQTNKTKNSTDEMENGSEEMGSEGYSVIQLNGSTVDLTRVVGENAQSIARTELEAGSYHKIELYSSSIDASVNNSTVEVKIPPGKLMMNKGFNVTENTTTEFVFDIQVVLRGNERNNQGYILKPVISESGVAGEEVEVERGPREDRSQTQENSDEEDGPEGNPGTPQPGGGPEGAGPP